MANQFLTASYVDAYLGPNVRSALFTDEGGTYSSSNFNTLCQAATALIETALRLNGYAIPAGTSSDISGVSEMVKLATFGVFFEMAASRPEHMLRLPDNWPDTTFKQALAMIRSGDAALEETVTPADAIGGMAASEYDPDITSEDGSRPAIFSRKGMQYY